MADEYSDEEFSSEEAEPAYEAEFDDDDVVNGEPPNAMVDVYEETYDAEFEPTDVQELPAPGTCASAKSEVEAPQAYEADAHNTQEPSDAEDKTPSEGTLVHSSGPSISVTMEKTEASSTSSAPVDQSSDPLMVPRRRWSSEPQLTSALGVDPELDGKLARRSSSPRLRVAPIARLHSVKELSPVAPEDLQIPTNAITEEAAVIVNVATGRSTSPVPPKRLSSLTFVPRLPSLLEMKSDPSIALDAAEDLGVRDAETDRDNNEGGNEDDNHDGEYTDDAEDQDQQHNRNKRGEALPTASDKTADDRHQRHSYGEGAERLSSISTAVLPTGVIANTATLDAAMSASADVAQEHSDKVGDRDGDDYAIVVAGQDERGGEECEVSIAEDVVGTGSSESGSVRSTPPQFSEHAPEDDATKDQVIAEVNATEAADQEMRTTGDLDDNAVYFAVIIDDDSRRETRHLLQEAHALLTEQTDATPVLQQPAGNSESMHDLDEADSNGRYDDDDQSDSAYDDDDQELDEGAYYDSDQNELDLDLDGLPTAVQVPLNGVTEQKVTKSDTLVLAVQTEALPTVQESEHPVEVQNFAKSSSPTAISTKPAISEKIIPQAKAARSSLQPTSLTREKHGEMKPRAFSQGSTRPSVRPQGTAFTATTPREPDVPKLTPKPPVPRQQVSTSRQSHRITITSPSDFDAVSESDGNRFGHVVQLPPRQPGPKPSPARLDPGTARLPSPVRECLLDRASSPRKAPVFRQKRTSADPNGTKRKLKPVKCPPNLRIDLPHVDKEKREWLLLNMFRHGDHIDKYGPFIPTMTPDETIQLHLPLDALKRPLSANKIFGEAYQVPRRSASRGAYGRHGGRRIVDQQPDPRKQERERNWVSSIPSVSSIPDYDSILDKYCKTVTSPVVQRLIYETRMDDLSPQLAMVLEKRAFKEWKHGESDGFGAVSNSYKATIVSHKSSSASSTKTLHTPRPPTSPATTALPPDA
jgi:hypothetical protein